MTALVELQAPTPMDSEPDQPRLSAERALAALQAALTTPPAGRIPTSTYRVQFNEAFTFEDACHHAAYLHQLGAGDLYGSPAFHATSPHGYDINDHTHLNPALGGEAAFQALLDRLRDLGMGYVMDIVPNHMGIAGGDNRWWNDVLENGEASAYAPFFDIDWEPLRSEMRGQVLLPILGEQYGAVLEQGQIQLAYADGAFAITVNGRRLPVDPGTYPQILESLLSQVQAQLPAEDLALMELQSILTAIRHLPVRGALEPEAVAERQREKEIMKRRLAVLVEATPLIQTALDEVLVAFNGDPARPESFNALDTLLASQAYRLAFWKVATEEINYRRFFDINDLAAIRMERPEVFQEAHELPMRLISEGGVTGLRIDHPDGLWDPSAYFRALEREATVVRARTMLEQELGPLDADDLALLAQSAEALMPTIAHSRPLYLLAEKIVEHGEALPTEWAIHGTSGYEFLNSLGGLWVDRQNERHITETYTQFIGERQRYAEMVYEAKLRILRTAMASELNVLAHALMCISSSNRHYRDFTLGNLTETLRGIIAAFPVYRSYIDEGTTKVSAHDREVVQKAIRIARRHNPDLDPSLFEFMRQLLLLELPDSTPEEAATQRRFVMKFQQLTGPVMAKGLEDTTFYRYNRLVALNEVGGNPNIFGTTPADFHHDNLERQRLWPHTMLATSTHDTKRSEDVRARIAVLSEMPALWRSTLAEWAEFNRGKKRDGEDEPTPSANDEYLLYQSLLGAWPLEPFEGAVRTDFVERMVAYMKKAANEAKVHTSWTNPSPDYDQAMQDFVEAVLADEAFLAELAPLQTEVAHFGALNALAQTTLKYAAPGVPDLYGGNETWNFSLVDPDNRRPVPYADLSAALTQLEGYAAKGDAEWLALASELLEQWQDGRIKLWITYRALTHRRANPELYRDGAYQPLEATGQVSEHVVAFARTLGAQSVVAVAPRLLRRLAERVAPDAAAPRQPILGAMPWQETALALPAGTYRHLFTGEHFTSNGRLDLGLLFANFPVALLQKESA